MTQVEVKWIEVPFAVDQRPHLKHVLEGIEGYMRQLRSYRIRLPYYYPHTPLRDIPVHAGGELLGQICGVPTREHLGRIREKGVPTVVVNCPHPVPGWCANVELDFGKIGRMAVDHFCRQRVTEFGFFGSMHPDRSEHRLYRESVRAACAEAGVRLHEYDQVPLEGGWSNMAAQAMQWQGWASGLPQGAGVICADDEFATRLLIAAAAVGRVVGEDLFILGMGDDETLCESLVPALSSIQVDYFQMGWEAAKMLDHLVRGGAIPEASITIGFSAVIVRESSRVHALGNAKVQQAVAEIWDRVGEGVTVEEVAKRVHVDRRHLHRLFLEQLGHSPMAEIQRARVETAKRLLCESRESLASIAAACGFADQAHMARSVKKATGRTPGEFRLMGRRG